MKALFHEYQCRMQRALDHIDRHLDEDLDLDAVSGVAAFSKYHFHRQFTANFGLSLHRYVQLARMKRASFQLAFRNARNVTDVALDAGYDAPDAFARAFRQRVGQSPSSFRRNPDWESWLAAFGPLNNARSKRMQNNYTSDNVTVREVEPISVAFMEHRGNPASVGSTIQRFIAWRKAAGLSPRNSPTFNIFHSDPHATPPHEYRMDLCVGTEMPIMPSSERIEVGTIPGGRCAVLRVIGGTDNLEAAALYLYREWLPDSGEEARDFPLYCQRLTFFPEVSEHEAMVDLFLPLK